STAKRAKNSTSYAVRRITFAGATTSSTSTASASSSRTVGASFAPRTRSRSWFSASKPIRRNACRKSSVTWKASSPHCGRKGASEFACACLGRKVVFLDEMYTLNIEDDQGKKTEVPFGPGVLTVGRDASNNVCLDERNVSRKHAKIQAQNGTV